MHNEKDTKGNPRILILSPDLDYYKDRRGIYRFSLRLIKSLKLLGCHVDLVTSARIHNGAQGRANLINIFSVISHLSRPKAVSDRAAVAFRKNIALRFLFAIRRAFSQLRPFGQWGVTVIPVVPLADISDFDDNLKLILDNVDRFRNRPGVCEDIVKKKFFPYFHAPVRLFCYEYDLVISTQPYAVRVIGAPMATVVHDLFPVLSNVHPGSHDSSVDTLIRAVSNSHWLLCISLATRESLINLILRLGISVEGKEIPVIRQSVTPCDPILLEKSLSSRGLLASSFVCIGTLEKRKLQSLLYTMFTQCEELRDATISLVGGADIPYLKCLLPGLYRAALTLFSGSDEILEEAILEGGAFTVRYRNVLWYCNSSDEIRDALLSQSNALLFPSLNEGYGIPVVEGMSLGVPIVVRDLPVFREISSNLTFFRSDIELLSRIVMLSGEIQRSEGLIMEAKNLSADLAFADSLQNAISALNVC